MKYPISIIGLIGLSLASMAQPVPSLSALPSVTINLRDPGSPSTSTFSHFEVIDERSDTTRIGIHTFWPTIGHPRDRQLVFHSAASNEIGAYLNDHFARPGAPYTALIVLRNLWLSDASYLREEIKNDPKKQYVRTHIRFKAEIYAVRDSQYMPILRFDTLQAYKRSNMYSSTSTFYDCWDRDLTSILNEMTDSASQLTIVKAPRARTLRIGDILEFNRSRFDAPISRNGSLTPGVYVTFQEFRNNTPSVRDYEIRTENNTRVLYMKEAGGSAYFYSHNVWGYCDGKSVFVMRDGILHRTWREENAFYLFGPDKELTIDMDTGLIY
ncbi:MAG TPA: hypothetical protein VNW04_02045 [Puia sp.]|jgi:hypothetical protein|nr:hypothetical protein [Puia sp.]